MAKSQSLITAIRYTDRVYARCERIGDVPYGGVERKDPGKGIRMVPFEKDAVILYTIERQTVWITNIFAGGRDYETIIRGRT